MACHNYKFKYTDYKRTARTSKGVFRIELSTSESILYTNRLFMPTNFPRGSHEAVRERVTSTPVLSRHDAHPVLRVNAPSARSTHPGHRENHGGGEARRSLRALDSDRLRA